MGPLSIVLILVWVTRTTWRGRLIWIFSFATAGTILAVILSIRTGFHPTVAEAAARFSMAVAIGLIWCIVGWGAQGAIGWWKRRAARQHK